MDEWSLKGISFNLKFVCQIFKIFFFFFTRKVIQKATFWYKNHFVPISIDVRLIVNEPIELENKDITVMTISEYIKSYEADHPELIDLLIDPAEKKIVSKAVYEEVGSNTLIPQFLVILNFYIQSNSIYQ